MFIKKENKSGIKEFRFNYSNPFGACSYSYAVKNKGGKVIFEFEDDQHREFETMSCEIGNDILEKLNDYYVKDKIKKWDGFSKTNRHVLDGDGFSLEICFNDGRSLYARGSNSFPAGYSDFVGNIRSLFKPYTEMLLQKKIQEKIDEGISGELKSIMINFIQNGKSGHDRYKIFITAEEIRENNVDIDISSVSGEFFPQGKYRYYGKVSDSVLRFSDYLKIIEDNDIVRWNYYHKSAVDYNNCEWFQIALGFTEGNRINAMGTEHPEGYDKFRSDTLHFMAELAEELKKLPDNNA